MDSVLEYWAVLSISQHIYGLPVVAHVSPERLVTPAHQLFSYEHMWISGYTRYLVGLPWLLLGWQREMHVLGARRCVSVCVPPFSARVATHSDRMTASIGGVVQGQVLVLCC